MKSKQELLADYERLRERAWQQHFRYHGGALAAARVELAYAQAKVAWEKLQAVSDSAEDNREG